MDIKAMAKSKRSHTRHHQPRKPHLPSTTAAATSNSSDPKSLKREAREGKGPTQPPLLPSNWARYEDEDFEEEQVHEVLIDSDSGEPSRLAASKPKAAPDAVEPKSKGADFGYLIAQAKESKATYSPSFDDTLPDFYQGLGPMLAVKGESILSWDRRDTYLLEIERTASQEAPFLTLDLQALAEQLEKVDLAKRLFIEVDLLPPELRAPESNEADKPAEKKKAEIAGTFDELLSLYLEAEQEAERQNEEGSCNPEPASAADVTESKLDDLGFLDAKKTSLVNHVTKQDPVPPSRFDAMVAEAELGMLLNSFDERNPFDFSAGNSATHGAPSQHLLGPFKPEFPAMGGLDEALDDLLEETSEPTNNKDGVFQSTELQAASSNLPSSASSSTHPSSNSKVLDDFDSWFDKL